MIERYLKRICKQPAVYWGRPTSTRADGSSAFPSPIQIKCFWQGGAQFIPNRDDQEVSLKALIYVTQDLDERGMLYLGKLSDLTTEQKADPRLVSRAYEITKFEKIPSLQLKGRYNRRVLIAPETGRIAPGIERQ